LGLIPSHGVQLDNYSLTHRSKRNFLYLSFKNHVMSMLLFTW
jgi:hypothetical protein